MGTYTNYKLVVFIKDCDKQKYSLKDIISHLRTECDEAQYALNEDGTSASEAKWYKSDNDMKEFSKKYSDVLFCLNNKMEGEREFDDDDNEILGECVEWPTYFKNGKELPLSEAVVIMKLYSSL